MGVIAALLAVTGTLLGRRRDQVHPVPAVAPTKGGGFTMIRPLAAAYFFEGLGYIVTATFIVAIIAVTPGLESFAPYSWVAVGLAAVPSTVFWPWLARRTGAKRALLSAYVLQSAGILVSIGADTIVEVLFAAVSFGGTFLGIVALTLAEGSRRSPGEGGRAAAILTACFSVGQMLGPVFAGILADFREGFALPLVLAASCVSAGAVFIALDRRYQGPKNFNP
jgi:MFS family permease